MNLGRFFIDRPVFAIALSIALLIIGGVSASRLPISQYPEVIPPTVTVTAQYPGASAQTIAETVATPIEQEVNGVDDMIYMQSQSTRDGRFSLTVTFRTGANLDKAQVLVQNRVALAEPRLPDVVRRIGVSVNKNAPDFLLVVQMISPDRSRDALYLSNYAAQQVVPVLRRLPGVGSAEILAEREYAMRIWLDPDKIAELGLSVGDVVEALRSQNAQVASGALAQPPIPGDRAFQPSISVQGRFKEPTAFEQMIVKRGVDGRIVRVKDIGRAELGAREYGTNAYINDTAATAMLVYQRPGTNALEASQDVQSTMRRLGATMPSGVDYMMTYNPTEFFVRTSIEALQHTIFEAIVLVVLVVLLFLQSARSTIIPLLAIPVSLIGTFAVMAALGYTINTLTLFALVLAVGIVVDDAIVVVENVERYLREGLSAREAARKTMDEVGGALISIALVLVSVFVPTMFLDGITGQFFRQFAVVIAVATVISAFNSLTLSPALSGLFLRRHDAVHRPETLLARVTTPIVDGFNRFFDALSESYSAIIRRVVERMTMMLILYGALVVAAVFIFSIVPRGFVPVADQGYLIAIAELPAGSSLQRTDAIVREMGARARGIPGVGWAHMFPGRSVATGTQSSSAGVVFVQLEAFDKRYDGSKSAAAVRAELEKRYADITGAQITIISPATIRGIGSSGGFSLRVQDMDSRGSARLAAVTLDLVAALKADARIQFAFSPFRASAPEFYLDIDRTKAEMLGVPTSRVHDTLEAYLGSAYVNDFNLSGRTYQVIAQAEGASRLDPEQIGSLKVRSDAGAMVPLGSIASFRARSVPDRVPRYNLYPTAEVIGAALPTISSGSALSIVEDIAERTLPSGYTIAWTELSYQERLAAGGGGLFVLSVIFVFLVLAAQYESWLLPLSVILIVPMCLLSAIIGVMSMGQDNNVFTQVGLIVLVGLAAKNAILIVEFARDLEAQGLSSTEAVVRACRLRLRPILMTSLAFILGVAPLMMAKGAGAELRHAIGTAVFFGMLGVTLFGLLFTPVFYVAIRAAARRLPRPRSSSEATTVA
ncbi:efflux RND transporter permease subunit [Methylosinus sporium]|uniref:Efflux pump membrane transporter n=1 Tax=Methylosinus sporium TaxID=428 RepID=A0A2U1SMQ3_METSR|nr:multidrug efflux RND transporter permease subunit [Methylosinus sporium]PWB92893.1 hydrophobe/amphiphile efflux-1 family RND transporter [Methylosinus sporium]